jgi:phosphatidylglycerophosphatase A
VRSASFFFSPTPKPCSLEYNPAALENEPASLESPPPAQAPTAAAGITLTDRFALAVASGLGSGYSPFAPGTAGTVVAIPFYFALARLEPWLQILTTLAFIAIAVFVATRAALYWGDSDDGRIVSDEIAGYLVAMALVPAEPKYLVAGFLFFRLFDIVKPWPACWFDKRVHNGLGNVMDDVVAGLYARACMAALVWFWP